MVALVNKQTNLIEQKLHNLTQQHAMAVERRALRYRHSRANQDRDSWVERNDDSSNEGEDEEKKAATNKGGPDHATPPDHPFWVYLVDDIIAEFDLTINNITIELLDLPGELNSNYKHNHVGMTFSIPEISLQTNVVSLFCGLDSLSIHS